MQIFLPYSKYFYFCNAQRFVFVLGAWLLMAVLPDDAVHSANCRRKIVRLSVTRWFSVETAVYPQIFSLSGNHSNHHACFSVPNAMTIFRQEQRRLMQAGWKGKRSDLRPISHIISEMIQESIYQQWPTNRKSKCLSNDAIFNDLEQLLAQFSRSRHSLMLDVSQTAKDTATLLQNDRKPYQSFRMIRVSMTLSDLEWRT